MVPGDENLPTIIPRALLVSRSRKYEVLSLDKVVQLMTECIEEVSQVLELLPTITRILLCHFRWNKEKLIERFSDGDQDQLFKEANIISPYRSAEPVC